MTLPAPAPAATEDLATPVRYAAWAVYARTGTVEHAADATAELAAGRTALADDDVVLPRPVRRLGPARRRRPHGLAPRPERRRRSRRALRGFRRTAAGDATRLAFSLLGTHRPAEFTRDHVPSFMRGTEPLDWLCVYPFVRSYDWYLLRPRTSGERCSASTASRAARSRASRRTPSPRSRLNDYEWILALEADELHDLVDLMRHLRATGARRHVREEIPFYTGRRVDAAGALEVLR